MTLTPARPEARRLLPLTPTTRHGSRSHLTCLYRCGNACDQPVPNTSDNPEFRTIAEQALARRSLLKSGAGAGALDPDRPRHRGPAGRRGRGRQARRAAWRFRPVEPNNFDDVTVPSGFRADVLISWGDRGRGRAPRPSTSTHQTPEAAAAAVRLQQRLRRRAAPPRRRPVRRAGDQPRVHRREPDVPDRQLQRRGRQADRDGLPRDVGRGAASAARPPARGSSAGSRTPRSTGGCTWSPTSSSSAPPPATTGCRTTADDTGRLVKGTLNNCAGGLTPWGTVLSGEENFNQYFYAAAPTDRDPRYVASYDRYGVTGVSERRWDEVDPRFDLAQEPHEPFRFGWVVEVDPYDPESTPRKHTMLGRFKHEGANVTIAENGQVGRLHGRRRAVRLHLQVRLRRHLRPGHRPAGPAAQHAAADRPAPSTSPGSAATAARTSSTTAPAAGSR